MSTQTVKGHLQSDLKRRLATEFAEWLKGASPAFIQHVSAYDVDALLVRLVAAASDVAIGTGANVGNADRNWNEFLEGHLTEGGSDWAAGSGG